MDAPCNLQESIHVLVTKYLFVSSFWGTHQNGFTLFIFSKLPRVNGHCQIQSLLRLPEPIPYYQLLQYIDTFINLILQ